jgi:hypothetical protein
VCGITRVSKRCRRSWLEGHPPDGDAGDEGGGGGGGGGEQSAWHDSNPSGVGTLPRPGRVEERGQTNLSRRSARATLPLPGLMTITDARRGCHSGGPAASESTSACKHVSGGPPGGSASTSPHWGIWQPCGPRAQTIKTKGRPNALALGGERPTGRPVGVRSAPLMPMLNDLPAAIVRRCTLLQWWWLGYSRQRRRHRTSRVCYEALAIKHDWRWAAGAPFPHVGPSPRDAPTLTRMGATGMAARAKVATVDCGPPP